MIPGPIHLGIGSVAAPSSPFPCRSTSTSSKPSVEPPTVRLNPPLSHQRTLPAVAVPPQFTTRLRQHRQATHREQLKTLSEPTPPTGARRSSPSPHRCPAPLACRPLTAPTRQHHRSRTTVAAG